MAKMLTKMATSVYNKNSEDVNNDYNDGVCVKYVKKRQITATTTTTMVVITTTMMTH